MSKTALSKFRQAVLQIPLWLYFIVSVYPLFWMVSYSFKNNDEIFVSNPFDCQRIFVTKITSMRGRNLIFPVTF